MKTKRINSSVILACIVVCILAILVSHTVATVRRDMRQDSYQKLANATQALADEITNSIDLDRILLETLAAIMAGEDPQDSAAWCRLLTDNIPESSYMSYLELLWPDNTMLDSDGTVRDVSGEFDFERDAKRGIYISDRTFSTKDSDEPVVRLAVPVVRRGEPVAILYGVIRLTELAEKYRTSAYGGNAYVYVLEGDTGNFILDSWHKSLGNVHEFGSRKTVPGDSMEKGLENIKAGISGNVGFISQTTGEILYMHYAPLGINEWTIMLTVEQHYVRADNATNAAGIYLLAGSVGVAILLCVGYVLWSVGHISKKMDRQYAEAQSKLPKD